MSTNGFEQRSYPATFEVTENRSASAGFNTAGEGTVTVTGYASTFSKPYRMADMFGEYREIVLPGAFTRTLASDPAVSLLINHSGMPLASTRAGTMQLSQDQLGLKVTAHIDPTRSDAGDMIKAIRSGDMREMSFGFRIPENGQEWSQDYSERYMVNLDLDRGDVSAVTFGANPTTSISAG